MKLSGKPKKINHLVSTKLKPVSKNSNSHELVLAFIPYIFTPRNSAPPPPLPNLFEQQTETCFKHPDFY